MRWLNFDAIRIVLSAFFTFCGPVLFFILFIATLKNYIKAEEKTKLRLGLIIVFGLAFLITTASLVRLIVLMASGHGAM